MIFVATELHHPGPIADQITPYSAKTHQPASALERHLSGGVPLGRSQFAELIECEDAGAVRIRRELEVDRGGANQARCFDADLHRPTQNRRRPRCTRLRAAAGTRTRNAEGAGSDSSLGLVLPSQDEAGAALDVDPGRDIHLEQRNSGCIKPIRVMGRVGLGACPGQHLHRRRQDHSVPENSDPDVSADLKR